MKIKNLLAIPLFLLGCLTTVGYGQTYNNTNGCSNGQRYGITYTDCWVDAGDDTLRLQAAINRAVGKVIFNESNYTISQPLTVHSYRILEGTTKNPYSVYGASNITQTVSTTSSPQSIFQIGENIYDVSIRDLALVGGTGTTGTVGIRANGTNPAASTGFQFSNLKFHDLDKGIYVEANGSQYQFDNIRLDHSNFVNCKTGVHVNSWNSGWNISSISFNAPANGIGFYFEKSTYTSINLVIGNGPASGTKAKQLFWIKEHANMSIQNSVSEGFDEDILIDSGGHTGPIYLMNNYFNGKVTVNNAMVVSTGNNFGYPGLGTVEAIANNTSYIFSLGDKFCAYNNPCTNGWQLNTGSKLMFSSDAFKTVMHGNVTVNGDGSITYGSISFSGLGSAANGTVVYCSNCQQTATCSGGGSGAIAKRINGSWVCN